MSFLAQFLRLQDKRMVLINPVSQIKTLGETSLILLSFSVRRNSTREVQRMKRVQVRSLGKAQMNMRLTKRKKIRPS